MGENLYDMTATPTFRGMGNLYLGIACNAADTLVGAADGCFAPLNTQYGTINRRGSGGMSRYNAMNVRYDIQDIKHSGLTLRLNYTWSHASDELSDTWRVRTFSTSRYTDAFFNPKSDYGNALFDNRHRIAISAVYDIPFARGMRGAAKKALDGWELAPVFTARTGAPYTIYDLTNDDFIATRVATTQKIPVNANLAGRPFEGTNSYGLYDFSKIAVDESYVNPTTGDADFGPWPSNFTGRNAFRQPGIWNLDLGMYKNTRITERATLQLRLEAYNAVNHANFAINTGSAMRDRWGQA